jgi:hypothetical protein
VSKYKICTTAEIEDYTAHMYVTGTTTKLGPTSKKISGGMGTIIQVTKQAINLHLGKGSNKTYNKWEIVS